MRREEDRVQPLQRVGRVHVDLHVRRRRGVVHERQAAVLVHDTRQFVDRRLDARHVRTGGERADLQRTVPVLVQQPRQGAHVHPTRLVRRNDHHFRQRLQPGRMVRVVLHVGHEHSRALILGHLDERHQLLRHLQPQDALQLVHRRGHPEARRQHHVVRTRIHVPLQDPLRFAVRQRHPGAGHARLGVRVPHERAEPSRQLLLDRPVQPSARRPVGIDDARLAVGRRKGLVPPHRVTPEGVEVALQLAHPLSVVSLVSGRRSPRPSSPGALPTGGWPLQL